MTMRSMIPSGLATILIAAAVLAFAAAGPAALADDATKTDETSATAKASATEADDAEVTDDDSVKTDSASAPTTATATEADDAEVTDDDTVKTDAASAPAEASVTEADDAEITDDDDTPAVFTEEFLADAENIELGKEYWGELCVHCHGSKAYPGKAPKLKPARYSADFVYKRITDGFRKMPAWKDEFDKEERMQLTAWVLSKKFAP